MDICMYNTVQYNVVVPLELLIYFAVNNDRGMKK